MNTKSKSSRSSRSKSSKSSKSSKLNPKSPHFDILCQDSLIWLSSQNDNTLSHVITGIPDYDETPYKTIEDYLNFVMKVTQLIFHKVKDNNYCIFMITDRKYNKTWIDKSFLIQNVAFNLKIPLRWHKIILLRPVGSTHIQRPTYQHMLCFSKLGGPGEATPDVIHCDKKNYKNSNCINATRLCIQFIKKYSDNLSVIDPFVGRGTILIEAKSYGFSGIGIDIDPKQCKITTDLLK